VLRTRFVSLSPRLVAAMRDQAAQANRDVNACIEQAWKTARVRIASLPPPAPLPQNFEYMPVIPDVEYTDPKAEQVYAERFASDQVVTLAVTLPVAILDEMVDDSFRLARSLGWLVERAWCLALDATSQDWWIANEIASGDTAPMTRFD
jgi:hypothetical protein